MTTPDPVAAVLDALALLIARRVADELRPLLAVPSPSTDAARLTLDDLVRAEACSRATIRRLVVEGAPVHYVGQSPRFDLAEWRAWCSERGRKGTKAPEPLTPRATIAGVRLLSRGTR